MVCSPNQPIYANPPFRGIKFVGADGRGNIEIAWHQAWPKPNTYTLVYNIFYSSLQEDVFNEGVKGVIIDPERLTAKITDLIIGDVYYFAVRASQFEPNTVQLSSLPEIEGSYYYPDTILNQDITENDIIIPVTDVSLFPPIGIVQIGSELIGYENLDIGNNYIISSLSQRGLYGTEARIHNIDGYDGYYTHENPFVRHFAGFMDQNTNIQFDVNKFENNYASNSDGYKEKQNLVYTDTSATDEANSDLSGPIYSGYHMTNPLDLLSGRCLGSYYGGEYYCADGYDGVGMVVRGLPFEDQQNARVEELLNTTGIPCQLFIKQVSGKVSKHYDSIRENITHRGLDTYGRELVVGYEMFFSNKRPDGRIMIRFSPTIEDVERLEEGLESVFSASCWTLSYPSLKDGDFFITYNKYSGNEEWRFEIKSVEKNALIDGISGVQKFSVARVRITDPIAQVKASIPSGTMPTALSTGIGSVPGKIPPHVHEIIVNENITSLSQINQVTSVAAGHNHEVVAGIIQNVDSEMNQLGHKHTIILP